MGIAGDCASLARMLGRRGHDVSYLASLCASMGGGPASADDLLDCLEATARGTRCTRVPPELAPLQLHAELRRLEPHVTGWRARRLARRLVRAVEAEAGPLLELVGMAASRAHVLDGLASDLAAAPPHVVCLGGTCLAYAWPYLYLVSPDAAVHLCGGSEPPCPNYVGPPPDGSKPLVDVRRPLASVVPHAARMGELEELIGRYREWLRSSLRDLMTRFVADSLTGP